MSINIMKRLSIFCLVILFAASCKKPPMARTANTRSLGKGDPTARPYSSTPAGSLPGSQTGTESNGPAYRFIISFFSVASGPDRESMIAFEKWSDGFAGERKLTLKAEKISWGREGEMDYCYSLEGWTPDDQTAFVNAAKEQLKSAKQVNTFENEPCRHQKRP
ncbi:MAG: hypothetical protein ACKOQ6_08570 [Bacteroidota bacterium]